MKTTWIALGLDGNPLRRRTDRIAACAASSRCRAAREDDDDG
jgi:hypothetical protein